MKCSFCGTDIKRGQGILYVKKDGSLIYFDSGKCQANMLELGRKAAKLKWAREGALAKPMSKTEKTEAKHAAKAFAKAVKAEAKETAKGPAKTEAKHAAKTAAKEKPVQKK